MGAFLPAKTVSAFVNRWYSKQKQRIYGKNKGEGKQCEAEGSHTI